MNEAQLSAWFSCASDKWATPQWLFDVLDDEFHITLDPCASPDNAKCEDFFTIEDDGLARSWEGQVVFMNPPYGRYIIDWMKKAWEEARTHVGGIVDDCRYLSPNKGRRFRHRPW